MDKPTLIPDGYHRVALTEFRYHSAAVYFNRTSQRFYVLVDDTMVFGPINRGQLEVTIHAVNDVMEMKGRYGVV